MKSTTHATNSQEFEDGNFRKGYQQGCNYGLSTLDNLIRNGYTYEEAKTICLDFVTSELGKYRNNIDTYGHFPPPPQLICESDGKLTLMIYDINGDPQSRSYNPTKAIGLGSTIRGQRSIGSIIGNLLSYFLQKEDEVPNRLTIYIGERIRNIRIEDELSLEELAEKTYLSKGMVQAIEDGKVDITVSNLIYFAVALSKPLIAFLPPDVVQHLDPQYLTWEEMELLMLLHDMEDTQKNNLLDQVRLLLKGE